MAELTLDDLIAVSKHENGQLDINARGVFRSPQSRVRLVEMGIMDRTGKLTEQGLKVAAKVEKIVELLKKGVPIESRVVTSEKKAYLSSSRTPWWALKQKRMTLCSNGEMLVIGDPVKEMKAEKMPEEIQKKIPGLFKRFQKEATKQIFPHSYQVKDLGGLELVWLADEKQEFFIPVQAKYFDYVLSRFPTARIFSSGKLTDAVVMKVKNRGVKGIVAAVMPIMTFEDSPKPAKREGWKVDGEEVSGE